MESSVITMSEIYERFGRASETAQRYEYSLATVCLYLEYFGKGWWQNAPSPAEVSSLLKTLEGKTTLGQWLTKVRKLSRIDDENVDSHLTEALEARNFLMHEFFSMDTDLVEKFLELERCQEKLDRGMNVASRVLDALIHLHSELQDPNRRESIINDGVTNLATDGSGSSSNLN